MWGVNHRGRFSPKRAIKTSRCLNALCSRSLSADLSFSAPDTTKPPTAFLRERHCSGAWEWKWSLSVADVVIRGQAATKSEAVAEAERAIDRALAPKKLRLVRREDRD